MCERDQVKWKRIGSGPEVDWKWTGSGPEVDRKWNARYLDTSAGHLCPAIFLGRLTKCIMYIEVYFSQQSEFNVSLEFSIDYE